MIKKRILRFGNYARLSSLAQCDHIGHYKDAGKSESEREDIRKEAKVREKRRFYTAGFGGGRRGHKLKNTDGL